MVRFSTLIFAVVLMISASEGKIAPGTLAREAGMVVRGTVETLTVKRDANRRIFTELELKPSEIWKGNFKGSLIPVVYPGGVLGEEYTKTSGQPEYEIGEEVVLFLVSNGKGQFVTLGLGNGKFSISKQGSEVMAKNSNSEPSVLPVSTLKQLVIKNQ